MFCSAVGFLFAVSTASTCHAAMGQVTAPEARYCEQYAASEYDSAVARGDEFPDASFEGAAEECEVQWLMVTGSLDALMRADIALRVYEADELSATGVTYELAAAVADHEGRYGVDQISPGRWLPTTAAEDKAADLGAR